MNIEQVIELVEKYITDPKSVSKKELKAARDAVRAGAFDAAAAYAAADAALYGDTDDAKFWVAEYHGITEDNV